MRKAARNKGCYLVNYPLVPGMKMEEFQEVIEEWEQEWLLKNQVRMYKVKKRYRDPRKKAIRDYRHHRGTKWFYRHEKKEYRRYTNRRFRHKMKQQLYEEKYYQPIPHDYKTYGIFSW